MDGERRRQRQGDNVWHGVDHRVQEETGGSPAADQALHGGELGSGMENIRLDSGFRELLEKQFHHGKAAVEKHQGFCLQLLDGNGLPACQGVPRQGAPDDFHLRNGQG